MDVLLSLLFTTPIGLLSLFTILFLVGMGVFMAVWVKRNMNAPEE